jgi:hypothetical protein
MLSAVSTDRVRIWMMAMMRRLLRLKWGRFRGVVGLQMRSGRELSRALLTLR